MCGVLCGLYDLSTSGDVYDVHCVLAQIQHVHDVYGTSTTCVVYIITPEYTVHTPPGTSTTAYTSRHVHDVYGTSMTCMVYTMTPRYIHIHEFVQVVKYTVHVIDVLGCVEVIEYTKVIKYTVHIKSWPDSLVVNDDLVE
ncbi:hypothetical protein BDP27DRAFT_1406405 [Rhodocollybia butyracea]|uniref:Uncharacterized protein n=1 Tax=Rhodocollybia butyracea TaxID=206335 RepID=A0A9P5U105_9AGAR|nr:hypothetical protein BDP27DRAFT_1406405 [Rhodocollybia butyracea]